MYHCKSDDDFENEGDADKLVLAVEDRYNWTCEQDSSEWEPLFSFYMVYSMMKENVWFAGSSPPFILGICNAQKFKLALKPCFTILSTDVLPNILGYDNDTGMKSACR